MKFKLKSSFKPTGHQPEAISQLVAGVERGKSDQVLLGVTGSGKTFTMAQVIEQTNRPALVMAHNKTLAAQLYQEFRDFFPENAVSYFVSYYDYYQPEAYIVSSDTYIEKETQINDEIDRLRLAATTNLLTRPDVIVVASVSCIYNLGSPVEYGQYVLRLAEGEILPKKSLMLRLINLQYDRSDGDLRRGTFRERGESIQVWPAYDEKALRIDFFADSIEKITWIDAVSGSPIQLEGEDSSRVVIYPAKHYVVDPISQQDALKQIRVDLDKRLKLLKDQKRLVEMIRLKQKVEYDLEMIEQFGFVGGIENYSRYFDGRKPGEPPFTMLDYFKHNTQLFGKKPFLTFIDESHISLPQVRGMYRGDRSRKETLIKYGFRLPSALDNRPLQFGEFDQRTPLLISVSATPNQFEIKRAGGVVEQLVRPTGLLDPIVELRHPEGQIEDLVKEIAIRKAKGQRVLVTTLTKKMAEALTEYLNDEEKVKELLAKPSRRDGLGGSHPGEITNNEGKTYFREENLPVTKMPIGKIDHKYYRHLNLDRSNKRVKSSQLPKVAYLHSDIVTLERSDILRDLRQGEYDVVVGINLLREGLDLPEVSLVAILDADKEGFLRSETALIQTMGRAARHLEGQVICYAYNLTRSMQAAIAETQRRRQIQLEYNQANNINPSSISKPIKQDLIKKRDKKEIKSSKTTLTVKLDQMERIDLSNLNPSDYTPQERQQLVKQLRKSMKQAADNMDFEYAALLRDGVAILS